MSSVLKDKVAIITGAGRGLGKAFALRYAEEGARLFLPDISLERAEATAKEIKAKGGEALRTPMVKTPEFLIFSRVGSDAAGIIENPRRSTVRRKISPTRFIISILLFY